MLIARRTLGLFARVLPVLAAVLVLALVVAACGGDDDDARRRRRSGRLDGSAASDEPVTLSVGLFGTFGYKEAGLYDEYMELHPNVTIEETSIEFEQDYYQALQTHLAGGAGLSDIQGIEVARIAEVTQTQPDKWTDLNELGAGDLEDTFFPWKWQAASTTSDGAVLGLGTDTGPQAICYRSDLFEQAGPADRPRGARLACGRPGTTSSTSASSTWRTRPRDRRSSTAPSGLYNAIIGQSETQYYDEDGQPDLRLEPGRQGRLGHLPSRRARPG